jgi:hypothetical protein
MDKTMLTSPNILGRLGDYYRHAEHGVVRDLSLRLMVCLIIYYWQFLPLSVYMNNPGSIMEMRSKALDWITKFPQAAVLVVLEGHTTVGTGEIVYSTLGHKTNQHAHIANVSG